MQDLVIDLKAQELTATELALPAHLLFLMAQECRKQGLELRPDYQHKLNVASAAPLSQLDTLTIARVAKRVDDIAHSLLHDLSPDDARDGLYCCAQFCLKLVDEKRINDPQNMAVLIALALMDDLKASADDAQGSIWRVDEARWNTEAGRMMSRCVLQGLYNAPLCN